MEWKLSDAFKQVYQWGVKIVEDGNALYGYTVEKFRNQLKKTNLKTYLQTSLKRLKKTRMGQCKKILHPLMTLLKLKI